MNKYILSLSCPDRAGIVAAVSAVLAAHEMNIVESQQFGDAESGRFFMRIGFEGKLALSAVQEVLTEPAAQFDMDWQVFDAAHRPRVMILLSIFYPSFLVFIYRQQVGSLKMDIACVASNHETGRRWAENAGIAFHQLGGREAKAENEARLERLVAEESIDLVILARYMQILSADFVAAHAGRIINIHHSFLPSFKGAEPYSQAHRRGVKLIGATAHFVTADLDEGPIIAQGVEPVRHDMTVADFIDVGRDTERRTLARAVHAYIERRVFLNNGKTVIFD